MGKPVSKEKKQKLKKQTKGINILENTDAALKSKATEKPVCRTCHDDGCKERCHHHEEDCHDENCCHCEHDHEEDEHEHHHHGHHHGFIHEWGDEEEGEHHGHEGRGHHCCDHENCHRHCDEDCDGRCHEGENHHHDEGEHGEGYGWCRDVIQTSKSGKVEKVVQRFCVPLGYQGGFGGYPYWYGYPGVGLGLYGWGWPWIKNKVPGSVGVKAPVKNPKEKEMNKAKNKSKKDTEATKRQTVHVGYGYASGDNYRLGYQEGGMGGLSSNTLDDDEHRYDFNHKKSTVQKRHRLTFNTGMQHQHATPYGHPVTHPGFTTMGYPGHALASVDVRNKIGRLKRQIYGQSPPLVFQTHEYVMPNIFQNPFLNY